MRLHLDRDREEPLLWEETIRLDPADLGQDLLLELGPIEVRGRVDPIAIEAAGEPRPPASRRTAGAAEQGQFAIGLALRYEQALACTRCLAPVPSTVAVQVDLQVVTRPLDRRSPPPASEVELERDEMGVVTVAGEHLETAPLVAEQVLLEVPMKPLCRADCLGLCPRCGADRNLTPDCCRDERGDARWEALGELRDRLSASPPSQPTR